MGKNLTAREIIRSLKDRREEISRFGVSRIGLFGSYLRGNPKPGSDMDFLVSFRNPTFDNYMDLKFYLERLFGKRVDLVTEGGLKPSLKYVREQALYA